MTLSMHALKKGIIEKRQLGGKMDALIINLPSSTERLAFQKKQLQKLDIRFEVLQATAVNDLSKSEIENFSLGWERPLRAVELACFMSHKKAWGYVSRTNSPRLILEDDALLSNHAKSLLESLEKLPHCDLITLEIRNRKKVVAKEEVFTTLTNHKVFDLYQDRTGAAAYILWPSGADKLLEKSNNCLPALADAFISSCYSLLAFQIEPAAAIQLDQCKQYNINNDQTTESAISSTSKPKIIKKQFMTILMFKYRRLFSQIKMALRQLSVIRISSKRQIKIDTTHFQNIKNDIDII